eukprot:837029_1
MLLHYISVTTSSSYGNIIFNRDSSKSLSGLSQLIHQKEDACSTFVWSQIRSDLNILCDVTSSNFEDICIEMHLLLCDLKFQRGVDDKYDMKKEVDRDTFEQSLNALISKQSAHHKSKKSIIAFRNENKNAAHLRLLMIEILEQKNLSHNFEYRAQYVPHLFLRCESVTLRSFFSFVRHNAENEKLYPNLWRIIHCRPLFWCLKYLPHLARWLRLVYERYLRRKTLDECRQMSIEDILRDAQINKWGDINEWKVSWNKFRECWNYISSKTRSNRNSTNADESGDVIEHEFFFSRGWKNYKLKLITKILILSV